MPHPFPHKYIVNVTRKEKSLAVLTDGKAREILAGPPIEFDGREGYWSPETLLMSSVGLCFLTTLESLVAKEKIEILGYSSKASGILDKTKEGLVFTKIELEVEINAHGTQCERIRELVDKAKKYCLVSNALKTEVVVSANVKAD